VKAEAEAASTENPDDSAGSFSTLAAPEISVRVEYTTDAWGQYPGTYPAYSDFYSDWDSRFYDGGGTIYIRNLKTDWSTIYSIYITVDGGEETLGASGRINEIGSGFLMSHETMTPEGPAELRFYFTVAPSFGSTTPAEPELYYKVTGRLIDESSFSGPTHQPLTYDPAIMRGREPWISVPLVRDQTNFIDRVPVESDGSFEVYLLKTLIDALPENEILDFQLESPYLTRSGVGVSVREIKEEGWPIAIIGAWAGVITGTISRGHLPAGIIYDDTASAVRIEIKSVDSNSVVRVSLISLNSANDVIPFYLPSIPAGKYEVTFTYVEEWSWSLPGTTFQQYAPSPITVTAFEDTVDISTTGWMGDRDHYDIGDIYGPVVESVTPLGNNQPQSGELAITFNEPIDMGAGGTVRLVGTTAHPTYVPLTNGTWSNYAMTYTVAYEGLEAGRRYALAISDFRDVRRNVMGDDNGRYSLVVQGGEVARVFEHSASGISLSGSFTPDAKVNVIQGLAALGTGAACNTMREAYEAGLMLSVQDISVQDGRFIGPVTITIPLGTQYNDRWVYVLHCKEGKLEKIRTEVINGVVTFQLTSLSPIGVVLPEALNILTADYDFDAETATLIVKTNAGTTAWKNDTNLTPDDIENIVIEAAVTEIVSGAFVGCPINEVIFLGSVPPTIAEDAFYSVGSPGNMPPAGVVQYPADSAGAYDGILAYFPAEWIKEAVDDTQGTEIPVSTNPGTGGNSGGNTSVPRTGDSGHLLLGWLALATFTSGICCLLIGRKGRKVLRR
jgi:hypothetical protein